MSKTPIELKGSNFTLSVVHLHHPEPEVIRKALQDKIDQAPDFLKNAPVVLNVAALSSSVNWKKMQQAIIATGLRVVGVSGCKDAELKHMITCSGLPLLLEGKENKTSSIMSNLINVHPVKQLASKTRIISTPVRSGQQIYARNTDLIVTSSVSAGAELVADGNIHIYGVMRGRVLAGASGDSSSQIFCTNLIAELVSIAGEYWMMDQIPKEFFGKAIHLYLSEGALNIQILN
ncbi:septum site-determining protein MinC [Pantoea sp. Nvir]|uniref:septum site-determining protein MinC n=1 Tax=Pantoea sp. Nvir TaxID=2576760 RepID=UPI0027F07728|nr:septum site-determining protein MinC [Pantoea sp. Nvir]CAJ0991863.1 Septum site-determining protein MinC [Pantoea sp. Nvir]